MAFPQLVLSSGFWLIFGSMTSLAVYC